MQRRRGVMEPPERGRSRPLMEAERVAELDLRVELRRGLWLVVCVLAIVLAVVTALAR